VIGHTGDRSICSQSGIAFVISVFPFDAVLLSKQKKRVFLSIKVTISKSHLVFFLLSISSSYLFSHAIRRLKEACLLLLLTV